MDQTQLRAFYDTLHTEIGEKYNISPKYINFIRSRMPKTQGEFVGELTLKILEMQTHTKGIEKKIKRYDDSKKIQLANLTVNFEGIKVKLAHYYALMNFIVNLTEDEFADITRKIINKNKNAEN